MKTLKLILVTLTMVTLLLGCKKDNLKIENGTYTGTFTVTYSSGTETGSTTLELKNGKYTCTGNPGRIPAGGSGSYSFDSSKITFNDVNYWTGDFDWNLILNGQYNYTFDGKNLKISADKNNVGHYEYNLEKQ
ncbi:MAG: hypothetical protein IH595_07500 [Bacteroidales bacterium]|nr:hypothetical protein [Bacteroidales bacterium]